MFDYPDTIRKLNKLDGMGYSKSKRYLTDLVTSSDFLRWVYIPDENKPISPREFNEVQKVLITTKGLRSLSEGLEDSDYYCDRAVATFLNALCGVAVEAYNKQCDMLDEQRRDGKISNRDAKLLGEKVDNYRKDVEDLAKAAKRIVKHQVKNLSKDTGIDKSLCRLGFWYVPGPKYLSRNRVGIFLREFLSALYEEIATNGWVATQYGTKPDWKSYFRVIFGKDNIYAVATFILLEGVNSVDRFKGTSGMASVRECWDSLTEYALGELNDAPEEIRNQMIELYLKRVDRQFRNKRVDLRVDLLNLPNQFRDLSKTVDKYSERLMQIMERAKSSQGTRVDEV